MKKIASKRLFAFVLCVATTLFVVPVMTFADINPGMAPPLGADAGGTIPAEAGGESGQQVVGTGGKTVLGTKDGAGLLDEYIVQNDVNESTQLQLSKTIRGTNTENEFIIDLQVKSKQRAKENRHDIAISLVLDVSGSMNYKIRDNTDATPGATGLPSVPEMNGKPPSPALELTGIFMWFRASSKPASAFVPPEVLPVPLLKTTFASTQASMAASSANRVTSIQTFPSPGLNVRVLAYWSKITNDT